jgi:hypothetical protein
LHHNDIDFIDYFSGATLSIRMVAEAEKKIKKIEKLQSKITKKPTFDIISATIEDMKQNMTGHIFVEKDNQVVFHKALDLIREYKFSPDQKEGYSFFNRGYTVSSTTGY